MPKQDNRRRSATVSGPLARLDRSREELEKAWLVRLIERASLEGIGDLPTARIARELPELISDLVRTCSKANGDPYGMSEEQTKRTSALAALRSGREAAGAAELSRDVSALQASVARAPQGARRRRSRAIADATGAVQAAAVEELLPQPFSFLLIDIDGLKRINDAHGRQSGDRVLIQVATSMRRALREVDTAARLGGDEFGVVAPQQEAGQGAILAGRLAAAARDEVATPDEPPIMLSIGVGSCP